MKFFLPLAVLLVITSHVSAQPGTIDSTFGINGKIVSNMGFPPFDVRCTVVQTDGKIIVGGDALNGSTGNYDFYLARFNQDGTTDLSFGTSGIAYTDLSNIGHDGLVKLIIQPDGKILAGGVSYDLSYTTPFISLARYTTAGKPDSSFNGTGSVWHRGLNYASTTDMALIGNGKILVSAVDNLHRVLIYRFNSDGSVDNSFSLQQFPATDYYGASSVAIVPGGKFLVSGNYSLNNNVQFFVARYQSSGKLDSTFGTNGQKRFALDSPYSAAPKIIVTPDSSKFYVNLPYGWDQFDNGKIDLRRFNMDGSPDVTFATGGSLILTPNSTNLFQAKPPQFDLKSDGKIVFAGTTLNDKGIEQFSAIRFLPDGTPDNSFGIGGRMAGRMGGTRHQCYGVASQSDGKLLIAGIEFAGRDLVALTRVNVDASTDNSFLQGKIATVAVGTAVAHEEIGEDIRILPNNKILVASIVDNGASKGLALTKYNSSGTPDSTFGKNGIAYGDITSGLSAEWPGGIITIDVDSHGGIYVLSGAYSYLKRITGITVSKFMPSGSPDSTFAEYGREEIYVSDIEHEHVVGMAVQSDGKPVVACGTLSGAYDSSYTTFLRLNLDGSTDLSFGTNGKMRENLFSAFDGVEITRNQARRLIVQPDDKIIFCGEPKLPHRGFALRRYNADASIDTTFNHGFLVLTEVSPLNISTALALQPDGKIVVAGNTFSPQGLAVVRYTTNGTRDYTFGYDNIPSELGIQTITNVAVQPDGKILVSGDNFFSTSPPWQGYMSVARLRADGSIDSSFGYASVASIRPSAVMRDVAGGMAFTNDGRILLTGATNANWQQDLSSADFILYGMKTNTVDCSGVTVNAGTDTSICKGATVTLGAPGVPGYKYLWFPSTGLSSTTSPQTNATPFDPTYYTIKAVTPSGCVKWDTVYVNVSPIPTPIITANGPVRFCQGGSVQLSTTAVGEYQWTNYGGYIAGANGPTFLATASGQYAVRVTVNQQCTSTSAGTLVTVVPLPPTPVISQTDSTLRSSSATGNQWYLNDSIIVGATAQSYLPTKPGVYKVKVTLSICESAFSNAINYITTGIISPELDKRIIIAPNPVVDDLNIRYNGNFTRFEFTIVNISGTTILAQGNFTTSLKFDMRKFSAGTYLVKIINRNNGEQTRRMIMKL